ncbi:MAG: hypothetical protein H0X66_15870 [Verrucomicrobia bacterium]|nr:hypothetical protein [Verrucomicrobiota bacterium]
MSKTLHPSAEFEELLQLASVWVEEQERIVLRDGIPLNNSQLHHACLVGVAHPERVRVLNIAQIPIPEHPALRALCDSTKAITPRTIALSARYGILIRTDHWCERELVVHELAHTSQYERMGGVRPFLQQYMQECVTFGYPHGPMEQEAIAIAAKICGSNDIR